MQRQACFADTASANEGQQATGRVDHLACDLLNFRVSTHKRRSLRIIDVRRSYIHLSQDPASYLYCTTLLCLNVREPIVDSLPTGGQIEFIKIFTDWNLNNPNG